MFISFFAPAYLLVVLFGGFTVSEEITSHNTVQEEQAEVLDTTCPESCDYALRN